MRESTSSRLNRLTIRGKHSQIRGPRSIYALFMEMGTGKSKVAIDTIGILHMNGKIDAALHSGTKRRV